MTRRSSDDSSDGGGCIALAIVMFALGYCVRGGGDEGERGESAYTQPAPATAADVAPQGVMPSTEQNYIVAPVPTPSRPEPLVDDDTVDDSPSFAYYPNCSAARAAGAAPVLEGDPGYSRRLDRDGDGVGCE